MVSALFAILAMMLTLCVVPAARAAADTDGAASRSVEVGDVQVSRVLGSPGDQLRQWEFAAFDFQWSAPAGVVSGQRFIVHYPDGFHLYGNEVFQLKSKDGEIGGDCHVRANNQSVTCEFNDEFAGRLNVRGTLHTEVQAQTTTTDSHLTMPIDGTVHRVALPGAGGIIGAGDHVGGTLHTQGWYNDDYVTSGWRVDIPGPLLAGRESAAVQVTSTLSGHKHKFDPAVPPKVTAHTMNHQGGRPEVDSQVGEQNVSKFKVSPDGSTATFELNPVNASGQWEPTLLYRLRYSSQTADGQPAPKAVGTTNTVAVTGAGQDFSDEDTVKNWQSSSGTIHGAKKASYEVRQELSDAVSRKLIPGDATFGITALITTPDGEYWEEEIKTSLDGNTSGPTELPEGSVVELGQVTTPELPGITFGQPTFVAATEEGAGAQQASEDLEFLDGGSRVRFTTVASRNIKVVLKNTVVGAMAPFAVLNKVSGLDADTEHEFTFDYRCKVGDDTETGQISALGDGQPALSDREFPVGTECVITQDEKAAAHNGYRLITEPQSGKRTVTITGNNNIAQAQFVNVYARRVGGLAITKEMSNEAATELMGDQEFKFEASWELNGTKEVREFTLRAGDVYSDFPPLPLGTKVTLREREIHGETSWTTPAFNGSVGRAVEDHGDGSATISVLDEETELLVTVINHPERGFGWFSLLNLIPMLGGFGTSIREN